MAVATTDGALVMLERIGHPRPRRPVTICADAAAVSTRWGPGRAY
jgi:hypothetical protein